jgi:hypothetical protein
MVDLIYVSTNFAIKFMSLTVPFPVYDIVGMGLTVLITKSQSENADWYLLA